MLGGIEAGGTKFVLAAGRSPADIAARHVIPTSDPTNTLREAADWFRAQGALASLGIASFGPVDLDPGSLTWGHITSTPKPGWRNCDIAGFFAQTLSCPIGFDTDVNAAALAEWRARGASRQASLAYVTVGTGIGGGVVAGGEIFGRPTHPEVGHIRVARHEADGEFAGSCPYHGDCLEGLVSGPAIVARWGRRLDELQDEGTREVVAHYLGQLCLAIFSFSAVERVVMGGGVMETPGLLERVRDSFAKLDNCYLPGGVERKIEGPALGERSGITGALVLAENVLSQQDD
ncbi:ROK family protein [Qipengyuania sp. 902]|uniref:ROK family protein n=1 Tax=Qipengyuania sp. 902 TaxID=3417565 RepID=UPI003EB7B6CB